MMIYNREKFLKIPFILIYKLYHKALVVFLDYVIFVFNNREKSWIL